MEQCAEKLSPKYQHLYILQLKMVIIKITCLQSK